MPPSPPLRAGMQARADTTHSIPKTTPAGPFRASSDPDPTFWTRPSSEPPSSAQSYREQERGGRREFETWLDVREGCDSDGRRFD